MSDFLKKAWGTDSLCVLEIQKRRAGMWTVPGKELAGSPAPGEGRHPDERAREGEART